jgi:hypothetical protein
LIWLIKSGAEAPLFIRGSKSLPLLRDPHQKIEVNEETPLK